MNRRLVRVGALAAVVLAALYGGWRLARSTTYQLLGDIVARVDVDRPVAAITFDDGPSPMNTPRVLAVLRRHGVKATFFMIGESVAKYPEVAAAVAAEGHEGANHSYSHRRMVLVTPGFVHREITDTDRLLRDAGFAGVLPFRPPYGKKLLVLPYVLRELGKTTVMWDAEAHDTESQDPVVLGRNVLAHVRPGSIVLFHDGGAAKPGTVEALDAVLAALRARGFELTTVSSLLAAARRQPRVHLSLPGARATLAQSPTDLTLTELFSNIEHEKH